MSRQDPTKRDSSGKWLPGTPAPGPKGRAPTNAALREQLLEHLPEAIDQLIFLLGTGDVQALKLYLDRVIPPLRPATPPVHIPGLAEAGTLVDKAQVVINAVAAGKVSPDTASALLGALANLRRIIEVDELEQRIRTLEDKESMV